MGDRWMAESSEVRLGLKIPLEAREFAGEGLGSENKRG